MAMKRADLMALSRAAIEKVAKNKVGVIGATKTQLKKLEQHKKRKRALEAKSDSSSENNQLRKRDPASKKRTVKLSTIGNRK
jgi:hypothetical protein